MVDSPDNSDQISAALRKVLNVHGHGFHYAVVRRGEELSDKKETPWILEGTEIPVVTGDAGVHVDIVWSTRSGRTKLVSECKRADPAKARWCFARSPYRWFNDHSAEQELAFDELVLRSDRTHHARPRFGYRTGGSYQLGFELRTGQQGDGEYSKKKGPDFTGKDIDDSVAQVLRSTSGVINELSEPMKYPAEGEKVVTFIPALFTTAEIWATEADLGAADLATGNLSLEQVQAREVEWVWFTYNRSPRLSHDLPYESRSGNLAQLLRREYARSIAIIGVKGIDDFLQIDLEEWLD